MKSNNLQVEQYGETTASLMVVGPYKLHVYWEININDFPELRCQLLNRTLNNKYILRVYDISNIVFDGNNAHYYFDIDVDEDKENCYIDLWSAGCTYCVEVGIKINNREFLPLALSNIVSTPKVLPPGFSIPKWMKVEIKSDNTNLKSNVLKKTYRTANVSIYRGGKYPNMSAGNETRRIDDRLDTEQINRVIETVKNWGHIVNELNVSARKFFTRDINKVLNNPKHNPGFSMPREILHNRSVLNFSSMSLTRN